MANPENLVGKGFESRPNDINREGRPVGSRNRATILRELADVVLNGTSLDDKPIAATTEQFAMMAMMRKAMEGDMNAVKEMNDTLYGKIADKSEVTGKNGGPIQTQDVSESDEDIIKRFLNKQPKTE
jgi:hypothetical protein